MQKTALAILGVLLISGSAVQIADASEHYLRKRHHVHMVAQNQWAVARTRSGRNIQNFGFSGRDPSRVGGWSPWLKP